MRKLEYLSPTGINQWRKDTKEFYLMYLADTRAPRFAQTKPMSIGSAFDAHVKSFLHEHLFGKNNDPKFNLVTLFEAQVESQNRDWAWEHGAQAFAYYKASGALADLMGELGQAVGTPRFEIEVKGAIAGQREGITVKLANDVVLLGKPDVFYINRFGVHVILDWKVNGWCSKASPMPGYINIRSGSGTPTIGGPHKDCIPMSWKGSTINCGQYLNDLNDEWASQLAIYSWLCGAEVGEEFIAAIDQFACKTIPNVKFPEVRVAQHRLRVHTDYQWAVFAQAQKIWEVVHSDHIFRDLSYNESRNLCATLESQAASLAKPATEADDLFNKMTRQG